MEHVVVIDNGSGVCKAGFGGDVAPRAAVPAIVGRPKHNDSVIDEFGDELTQRFYVGDEALQHRRGLTLSYPISHGIITDWDDMEKIWTHCFEQELQIRPQNCPVLMTEAPLDPKANRETATEIMFEKYQVPSFYIQCPAVLTLYSVGMTKGCVLDAGDGVSHTVPIYDGYECPHAVVRADIGGRDVSQYLARILTERGHYFTTSEEMELVREIKEKTAYVAEDFEAECATVPSCAEDRTVHVASVWSGDQTFTCPDGQQIVVGSERFRCAEVLFRPALLGKEIPGLHECVKQTIYHCDEDIRKDLFQNIVLSGGSTMIPGLVSRLSRELDQALPCASRVNIISPAFRKFAVWIGGSIFASHSSFLDSCITAAEYEEWGSGIIHDRCPHS